MGIVYLLVAVAFFAFFIFMLIHRINQKKKAMKSYQTEFALLSGNVLHAITQKNKMNIVCEYISPTSKLKFTKLFILPLTEENTKKYVVGKKTDIQYPTKLNPKSKFFPVMLKNEKVDYYRTSLLVFNLFVLTSGIIFAYYLFSIIQLGYFADLSMSIRIEDFFDGFSLFIVIVMYLLGMQTVLSISLHLSRDEQSDYIKLFGVKATAKVVKHKPTGSKSAGLKEEMIDIEFYNMKNELIVTKLSTFYYKYTQYIDILYSPINHKDAVLCEK
jgi:hypothetical protein